MKSRIDWAGVIVMLGLLTLVYVISKPIQVRACLETVRDAAQEYREAEDEWNRLYDSGKPTGPLLKRVVAAQNGFRAALDGCPKGKH